jgi:hypothetical protein
MVVGRQVWVAPLLRCTGEEVDAEFALFFGAESLPQFFIRQAEIMPKIVN